MSRRSSFRPSCDRAHLDWPPSSSWSLHARGWGATRVPPFVSGLVGASGLPRVRSFLGPRPRSDVGRAFAENSALLGLRPASVGRSRQARRAASRVNRCREAPSPASLVHPLNARAARASRVGFGPRQSGVALDVIALMDALGSKRAVVTGFDWGSRAQRRRGAMARALQGDRCRERVADHQPRGESAALAVCGRAGVVVRVLLRDGARPRGVREVWTRLQQAHLEVRVAGNGTCPRLPSPVTSTARLGTKRPTGTSCRAGTRTGS